MKPTTYRGPNGERIKLKPGEIHPVFMGSYTDLPGKKDLKPKK